VIRQKETTSWFGVGWLVVGLVVLSQMVAFGIKIGPELTWRPVVFAIEVAICVATIRWSFRRGWRWPLLFLVLWQIAVAGMIWLASLWVFKGDVGNPAISYIFNMRPGMYFDGPEIGTRTAARSMLLGAVVLVAVVPRRRRTTQSPNWAAKPKENATV
jgi:uncharacterized membrane protein